ncbi:MAG: kinase, partial [Alphaproteobacteria bacterium PA3]
QAKLPVVVIDGRIGLPGPGQPTTHIVKPAMARFPATVENEALSMRLAHALGLLVAAVEARGLDERKFLLVERYDREIGPVGDRLRVHQEDFCQALGHAPEHKYAAEGGPTLKTSFALLRKVSTRPAADVLAMLDTVIFNVIIGNCDAHGKNFSLLYRAGETRLAPLYDLMSTVAYPQVSTRMAMKIASAGSFEEITGDTWAAFARDVGLGAPFVRTRLQELSRLTLDLIGEVADELSRPELSGDAIRDFAEILRQRAL